MGASEIFINELFVRQPNRGATEKSVGRTLPARKKMNPETENLNGRLQGDTIASTKRGGYVANSRSIGLAKSIRRADKDMEMIQTRIDETKKQLLTFVKNYPPFPPGSEERVRILKSYKALWKIIDQLTIPARHRTPEQSKNEKVLRPETPDRELLTKLDQDREIVHGEVVHTSFNGLEAPSLSENPTMDEVMTTIKGLERAKEHFEQKREQLFKATVDLMDSVELRDSDSTEGGSLNQTEIEAEQTSQALRDTLKTLPENGLTGLHSDLWIFL